MPFVSQAQRAKFGELVKEDKISQAEFDKWNSETGSRKLPKHVKKDKKKSKSKKSKHFSDREEMNYAMSKGMKKGMKKGMGGAY